MSERVLTLHPEGKNGVNLDQGKYRTIRRAILENLRKHGDMSFTELTRAIDAQLRDSFSGKISWYVVTVKLDLEARGEIERMPGRTPQVLRLKR